MRVSVIIPVWNGASVIRDCLAAVYAHTPNDFEVICVDNASKDDSTAMIELHFPKVRLLRQHVNLGFAGGVNVGVVAAQGDVCVLLNQDCMVQSNWVDALLNALNSALTHNAGIVGGTLLDADGKVDHAGARISRPLAVGEHFAQSANATDAPVDVDYVTGAVFAISRHTLEVVGLFDEGFHPAYYEESDYCYRARARGIRTVCTPTILGKHMRNSQAWHSDPLRHLVNQQRSRYRFVAKHFEVDALNAFFVAERVAIETHTHAEQAIARVAAARYTLQRLNEIDARRKLDLGIELSRARTLMLTEGFMDIGHVALARTHAATRCDDEHLHTLKAQAQSLLQQIFFRHPTDTSAEPALSRFIRAIKRAANIASGRETVLQSQLNCLNVTRNDALQRRLQHIETITAYDRD